MLYNAATSIFNFHSNMVLPTLTTSGLTTCVKAFGRAGMVELHGSWTVGLPPSTHPRGFVACASFLLFFKTMDRLIGHD